MVIIQRDRGDYIEVISLRGLENKDGSGLPLPPDHKLLVIKYPALVFKYPKKLPPNMTVETMKEQVFQEGKDKFLASAWEAFEKAMDSYKNALAEAAGTGADILAMKELNSALDNCAKGDCAACKGLDHEMSDL